MGTHDSPEHGGDALQLPVSQHGAGGRHGGAHPYLGAPRPQLTPETLRVLPLLLSSDLLNWVNIVSLNITFRTLPE